VDGVPAGLYYYRPREHALQVVEVAPQLDRAVHFFYNRPVFDRAAFELYLVGQTRGVEPLYGADAERFLMLEAGYMGQLLMMGQAACGVGLCPIGSLAFDRVRDQLRLDEGHRFLQAFLAGAAAPAEARERPVFAPPGPAPSAAPPASAAVVGMAGRYPGAADLEVFWANLGAGRRSIGPLPARRAEAWGGRAPLGGYLDDIERFDSLLFHISPAEARTLDPQLRMLLPVVWECLENAGHTAASLRGAAGRVGVFAGVMWHDFQQVGAEEWRGRPDTRISAAASDIPNRISHFFGFQGPSLAVDTSCSSSLTALHLAVESLRRGECGAAIVGAVNLVAHPYHLGLLASLGLIAPDGMAGAFDGAASGWSPGEGAGALLLRPAGAAEDEGDVVHGVIEATWVGHSGDGGRYGAPSAPALAASIASALDRAGLTPDDVDYVELAAAGASVADAAELEALGRVFAGRSPLAGTLKPNIGHLESASGMSQLAKVLLQLERGQIAPTLLAARRNPLVAWDGLPVRLVDRLAPWAARPDGAPRRALVDALGASGSYAHVVVRSGEARCPPRG
jgi:acyl transferase domain-containing protein